MSAAAPTQPPLHCLVVDDDPLAVRVVENCIANTPFLQSAGSCASAFEAAEALRTKPVDVLFLDVDMPGMTGLELLQTLVRPPLTVLVTSNPAHAADAFDLDVVDYLVKPVAYPRFLRAAQLALATAEAKAAAPPAAAPADATYVKVDHRLVRLAYDDVRYVEALGDYVHIVTPARKLIVHATMTSIEQRFPTRQFARIHRSYFVNLDHVAAIEDNAVVVDNQHLPIGASYVRGLMQRLPKF